MDTIAVTAPVGADTSKRITSLRFLLAVLVVFIHNNIDEVKAVEYGCLFNQSVFGALIQRLISEGIARAAVPLFFLFAAYLQARKNEPYATLVRKRARSLAVPFALWTVLYLVVFYGARYLMMKVSPSLIRKPENLSHLWTHADWIERIFGYRFGAEEPRMIAGQFWFVRDLFIMTLISPVLKVLVRRYPFGCLWLIATMLAMPFELPVSKQTLAFYPLGLYWGIYEFSLFEAVDRITWGELAVAFLVPFALEYAAPAADGTVLGAVRWCMVFAACALCLRLSGEIARRERPFAAAKYLAGFSFFLFAVHMPALNALTSRVWIHLLPMKNGFLCLAEYFGATALTIALGIGLGIALRRFCPPLFRLLTGGR